jgi:hypothetical protein
MRRLYQKTNPEKDSFEEVAQEENMTIATPLLTKVNSHYQKEDGYKEAQWFYVIISGGEKREKDYFLPLMNSDKFNYIKIDFIADPTRPENLLNTARNKKLHYSSSQSNIPDRYFIISDVDDFYDDLIKIKVACETENFSLIISNPCFEIWLYYGEVATIPTDFEIPENPLKKSQVFKNYLNQKIRGGVNPKKALLKLKTAIDNTENHYREDERGIPVMFSSNMFILGKELLHLIDSELDQMIEEEKQKRNYYTTAFS